MNSDERDAAIAAFMEANNLPVDAMPTVGTVAFWPASWPHVLLCGTVTSVIDKPGEYLYGFAETREYGVGRYFKPVFCLSPLRGAELKKALEMAEGTRASNARRVETLYNETVVDLLATFEAAE